MKLTMIKYKFGDEVRSMVMLVINWKGRYGPVGFEARPDLTVSTENRWVLDDEPTTIVHPVLFTQTIGTIGRVILTGVI